MRRIRSFSPRLLLMLLAIVTQLAVSQRCIAQDWSLVNQQVQPRMAKIFGAGGVRGLEAYQSGIVISGEGHILTVWSYVLDTDELVVVLDDGRKYTATLLGADPRLEIAVLKIAATGLAHYELSSAVTLQPGERVLAFGNLYGIATGNEPTSMLQGFVAAVVPLSARRGAFTSTYQGPVYVIDAMTNNAGAAGGALTDHQGQLAGLLGKELRSSLSNVWLNYAIPMSELQAAVQDIVAGKVRVVSDETRRAPAEPVTLAQLGLVLLPNILAKTPPYIERLVAGSPAEQGGLRPDDLIVMVGSTVVPSRQELVRALAMIDRLDPVALTVLRGQDLLPVTLTIKTSSDPATPTP